MAEIQKYFRKFHENIKLIDNDENSTLREKRETLLNKLSNGLKKYSEENATKEITFDWFNQGSYAMNTGVEPPTNRKGDYDIDVGLIMNVDISEYKDPVIIKEIVFNALNSHPHYPEMKTPCITVQYQKKNEPLYHVDLAIYAYDKNKNLRFAIGKDTTPSEKRLWGETNPKGLIKTINEWFRDAEDREQFRRCIRYLKRWKDLNFSANGNAAPVGIGLTIAALQFFNPVSDMFTNEYDDLQALIDFITISLSNFTSVFHDNEMAERLIIKLPVEPHNDVFDKMSNKQMEKFKDKLEKLLEVLNNAKTYVDPHDACKALANQAFGDDFPVPEKSSIGKTTEKSAFIPSSRSA